MSNKICIFDKNLKNNMEEIWKDIVGYEGLYQVSNLGRVKSLNYKCTKSEKILKTHPQRWGYLLVKLSYKDKAKDFQVHRLVASAFLDNPNNLPQVNHKDKNPSNNKVDNLEWCTPEYNTDYSCAKPILQFTKDGKLVRKWNKIKLVEKELGLGHTNITACCKGRKKTGGGYKWRYYYKGIWLKNHIPLKDRKVA